MATAKIVSLAIRTIAKPIATQIKYQAAQHETFKKICISLAQFLHRTESRLRVNLLPGKDEHVKIRPLNDAKAISNGANAISEGFLFLVAALIIVGETYRGSRSRAHERDKTEEEIKALRLQIETLTKNMQAEDNQDDSLLGGAPTTSLMPSKSSDMSDEYLFLVHSVQILWALAEKRGWFNETESLPAELKWLLEQKELTKKEQPPSKEQSPSKEQPTSKKTTQDSQHDEPASISSAAYAQSKVQGIAADVRASLNSKAVSLGASDSMSWAGSTGTILSQLHLPDATSFLSSFLSCMLRPHFQ
ncbi:hypothetical protein MNAN1_002231 [Malassezia nana]|uniref:OPA3-like protein n=1 Tax=Malassezia nana TaxID=180528 RepID=A0AAF0J7N8_9BASI|nr:hypothetical protein MNAN1_002231 [Malassezia nana]